MDNNSNSIFLRFLIDKLQLSDGVSLSGLQVPESDVPYCLINSLASAYIGTNCPLMITFYHCLCRLMASMGKSQIIFIAFLSR